MTFSVSRFLLFVAFVGALEAGVFAWRYSDLMYLSRPVAALATDPVGAFAPRAAHALAREELTRATLETLANAARARQDRDLAIAALERLAREYEAEARVHVRLADALREAGRLDEARGTYARALAVAGEEPR
jgi:Flp pilus assembly protein TadD